MPLNVMTCATEVERTKSLDIAFRIDPLTSSFSTTSVGFDIDIGTTSSVTLTRFTPAFTL